MIDKQCCYCGKWFKSYEYRKRKFCSYACSNTSTGQHLLGVRRSIRTEFKEKPKVTYRGLHSWLVRNFGYPVKCEFCNKKGHRIKHWNIHYALKRGHEYKKDVGCFLTLCISCHFKYDGINKKIS